MQADRDLRWRRSSAPCRSRRGAQAYPNRPITLVIPLPPGGTNDIMARAVADKLSTALGQQIVIENRAAGGSGTVGTRQVAKSAPDGYTLLLGYTSHWPRPEHVSQRGLRSAQGFRADRPDRDRAGLAAGASERAGPQRGRADRDDENRSPAFQVGTPGIGTVNYLASVLFAQQAGVDVQQIPYKGSNPLITDLAGGHVKVGFNPIPVSRAALEGGLIRALAGTSLKRSTLFPDLPTVAESALPGFDAVLSYGLVAPAGTPQPIIERLNKELRAALATDEVKSDCTRKAPSRRRPRRRSTPP